VKPPERFLDDAERAERAGDLAAAAVALRGHLERHPDDRRSRLRFARLLAASGEQSAARAALAPLETLDPDDPVAREATRRLAELDEAEGALLAAAARWERLLADDIDDPQARAHLARLRPEASAPMPDPLETLTSPEGIETSRYRLLREIGRGATAAVYLARDVALNLDLALKVLHPQLAAAARGSARRRFFAEARLAAAIRHPGVAAIYDVDEEARALAMEYVPGGTLRERIRAHASGLPLPELEAVARSLFAALDFVHTRGVAHGDLKPSNLLLRRPGEVVLADFGAAELAGEAQRVTGVPAPAFAAAGPGGTPLYLAPEQFRGAPASRETDLYATGTILWEALTGRALRTHADLVRGVRADTPPPEAAQAAAARAPEWVAAIFTLLDPDPARRVRRDGLARLL
jgi:tRNA A-37 threonylcarbamoyl transferase component Bud32